MPEGDTLYRSAAGLRPHLVGRAVTAASARAPGPKVDRLVGATITEVEALGKNLLIRFDNGLEVRTHLRMRGSWHRYRPGERWLRAPSRARLVLEVPGTVAVCFDAPTVELLDSRAVAIHPALKALGPDLLAAEPDLEAAVERLRSPSRAGMTVAEALLDQTALAGLGNVYRSEVLFMERVDPFATVGSLPVEVVRRLRSTERRSMPIAVALLDQRALAGIGNEVKNETLWVAKRSPWTPVEEIDDDELRRLIDIAREQLRMGAATGRRPRHIYDTAGRACPRCGTSIRVIEQASDLPRLTYWCQACQPDPRNPR